MSPRALLAHMVLCIAALGFAWFQANRVQEKKGGATSVVLLDAAKGDVVSVEYKWARGTSKVTSTGGEKDRRVVVALSREIDAKKKDDKKKLDAKGDAGPAADTADAGTSEPVVDEEPKKREESKFPAGRSVMNGVEALEPLKTRRTLGEVDDARLKAMGLDNPERFLVATTKSGKTIELELGEASFGGQGRYARVKGQQIVHLLDPVIATGFEGAADTMMEKRAITADPETVVQYAARFGDKEGVFVHKDRDQAAKRKFVPKDDLASTREEPGKVMTTLRALRGSKLLTDDQKAGSAVATFALQLTTRKEPLKIELLERIDGEGYLLRVDGWLFEASETQTKELLEDLEALFAS